MPPLSFERRSLNRLKVGNGVRAVFGWLKGAFKGVFEVFLCLQAPEERKPVFADANFSSVKPRKTRGF